MPLAWQLAQDIAADSITRQESGGRVHLADEAFETQLGQRFYLKPDDYAGRLQALGVIGKGLLPTSSIDTFIDQHRHDPLVDEMGKVQIARHILRAEAKSKLHVRGYPQSPVPIAKTLHET